MNTGLTLRLLCRAVTKSDKRGIFAQPNEEADAVEPITDILLRADEQLLTAPELRAVQTAEYLWPRHLFTSEPLLAECYAGEWMGKSLRQLVESAPEAVEQWMTDIEATPHHGESLQTMHGRTGKWLNNIIQQRHDVFAITHASVIRSLIAHALSIEPSAARQIDIAPLALIELGWRGRWRLRLN